MTRRAERGPAGARGVNRVADNGSARGRIAGALVMSGVILAAYALWQVEHWAGASHKTLIGDLFFIPMNLAAVAAALMAARRCRGQRRIRRSWQLLALALVFY